MTTGAAVPPMPRQSAPIAPAAPLVSAHGAEFAYPDVTVGPVTLDVAAGDRIAVLGRNGAGKTTIMRMLAGHLSPSAGVVEVGRPRGDEPTELLLKQRAAYVSSSLNGFPWYTVEQHFAFLEKVYSHWSMPSAMELARRLDLPLARQLGALSHGNAMKLSLCVAWGQEAALLLLDEPTVGLDPVARTEALEALSEFAGARAGSAVLYATHLLDEVPRIQPTRLLLVRDRSCTVVDVKGDDDLAAPRLEAMLRGGTSFTRE